MVELALVLPILLVLLLGIFDLGRAIYAYNTVSNAARAAVRVAVVDQNQTNIENKARSQTIALEPGRVKVVTSPLTTCTSVKIGCPARIRVEYAWQAITPVIGAIVGPLTVGTTAEMLIERVSP